MTSYYCQHLYLSLYLSLSKAFCLPSRWYDFSLQRYLGPKGKIISNGLQLSPPPLSLSRRYWQLHACHACVGQWRTSSALFFFSTSTRRDVRISREKLGHRVFFRNGGRHSRFSSAFNVTFDLSYLASHLSYRLQTKCILKWKSFVVRWILNKYVHDISCQDWCNST